MAITLLQIIIWLFYLRLNEAWFTYLEVHSLIEVGVFDDACGKKL